MSDTIRQALDLVVQAYNVGELPRNVQIAIQDVAEELALEIDVYIRFRGGNLYIVDSEDEEEEEDGSFLESARIATEAVKQDDSLFDGTYSQGDVNEIERPEQQLGLISVEPESIIDEY